MLFRSSLFLAPLSLFSVRSFRPSRFGYPIVNLLWKATENGSLSSLALSLFLQPPLLNSPASLPFSSQKHKTTTKRQSQKLKHADPTRASTAALSLFVARLLAGEVGGGGSGDEGVEGGISDAAAVAEAASRLARRHLGVAEQLAAEKKASKAATEAPKAAAAEAAAGEGAPDGGGAAPQEP